MQFKLFTLGYYKLKLIGQKWVSTGEIVQMNLEPMTHTQACTMKSKMSDPSNFILIPLN
jgi:hypothetical protein